MKPAHFFSRTLALLLTLALSLPAGPAAPLKFPIVLSLSKDEGERLPGCNTLRITQEGTGLEELHRALTPTAGLEEKRLNLNKASDAAAVYKGKRFYLHRNYKDWPSPSSLEGQAINLDIPLARDLRPRADTKETVMMFVDFKQFMAGFEKSPHSEYTERVFLFGGPNSSPALKAFVFYNARDESPYTIAEELRKTSKIFRSRLLILLDPGFQVPRESLPKASIQMAGERAATVSVFPPAAGLEEKQRYTDQVKERVLRQLESAREPNGSLNPSLILDFGKTHEHFVRGGGRWWVHAHLDVPDRNGLLCRLVFSGGRIVRVDKILAEPDSFVGGYQPWMFPHYIQLDGLLPKQDLKDLEIAATRFVLGDARDLESAIPLAGQADVLVEAETPGWVGMFRQVDHDFLDSEGRYRDRISLGSGYSLRVHYSQLPNEPESAGLEEGKWPSVVTIRPVLQFPTLAPDPKVERMLTFPYAKEIYREALRWMSKRDFQMPKREMLFDQLRARTENGRIRVDRDQLDVSFQQVEKETRVSKTPIFELPQDIRSVRSFLTIYLLNLQKFPEEEADILIPPHWSLRRLQRVAARAKSVFSYYLGGDSRWTSFIERIQGVPRFEKRVVGGEPIVAVRTEEISSQGQEALRTLLEKIPAATEDLKTLLGTYLDRKIRLQEDRDGLQEMEVPLPAGWSLGKLTQVVEAQRPALETLAQEDPQLQGTLREIDRLTGTQPELTLTSAQAKTIRAYQREITHTSKSLQLPTAEQIAADLQDVVPNTVASRVRELRHQFEGRRRAGVYLPLRGKQEFLALLEEWLEAYNRDHHPDARISVEAGRLYQIYVVFQRLSDPDRHAPVRWEALAQNAGKIQVKEAHVRFEALSRLFTYVGIPLAEPWDATSASVRLADKPGPELPAPPTKEELVSRRLKELFQEVAPTGEKDWPLFLQLAHAQLVEEGLLDKMASLPVQTVEALHQKFLKQQQPMKQEQPVAAGLEETSSPVQALKEMNDELGFPKGRLRRAVRITLDTDLNALLRVGGSLVFPPVPLEYRITALESNTLQADALIAPQSPEGSPSRSLIKDVKALEGYIYIPPAAGLEERGQVVFASSHLSYEEVLPLLKKEGGYNPWSILIVPPEGEPIPLYVLNGNGRERFEERIAQGGFLDEDPNAFQWEIAVYSKTSFNAGDGLVKVPPDRLHIEIFPRRPLPHRPPAPTAGLEEREAQVWEDLWKRITPSVRGRLEKYGLTSISELTQRTQKQLAEDLRLERSSVQQIAEACAAVGYPLRKPGQPRTPPPPGQKVPPEEALELLKEIVSPVARTAIRHLGVTSVDELRPSTRDSISRTFGENAASQIEAGAELLGYPLREYGEPLVQPQSGERLSPEEGWPVFLERVSARARRAIRKRGITSMIELSWWTWHDFIEMPGVGVVTVGEIVRIARDLGYPLGSGLEERRAVLARVQDRVQERMDGLISLSSAPRRAGFLVIGPSLDNPALKILAGLEGRVFVDDGKDPRETVVRLIEAGAEETHYLGGLEEARNFERFARVAEIGVIPVQLRPGRLVDQIRQIFASLGISEGAMTSGLEEVAHDLEKLGEEA